MNVEFVVELDWKTIGSVFAGLGLLMTGAWKLGNVQWFLRTEATEMSLVLAKLTESMKVIQDVKDSSSKAHSRVDSLQTEVHQNSMLVQKSVNAVEHLERSCAAKHSFSIRPAGSDTVSLGVQP